MSKSPLQPPDGASAKHFDVDPIFGARSQMYDVLQHAYTIGSREFEQARLWHVYETSVFRIDDRAYLMVPSTIRKETDVSEMGYGRPLIDIFDVTDPRAPSWVTSRGALPRLDSAKVFQPPGTGRTMLLYQSTRHLKAGSATPADWMNRSLDLSTEASQQAASGIALQAPIPAMAAMAAMAPERRGVPY